MYDLLDDASYCELTRNYGIKVFEMLFAKKLEFSVVVLVEAIDFNPKLPDSIMQDFGEFILLSLQGYTYESALCKSDFLQLEAGFGSENIGSLLSIPYDAVLQIILEQEVVFLNPSAKFYKSRATKINKPFSPKDVFKNNPKNAKLFH